jgi:hypothetical protein
VVPLQVVQPVREVGQRAAEPVDVADVALHPGALEPARVDLPATVEAAQLGGTFGGGVERDPQCPVEERSDLGPVAVELGERPVDVGERDLDPGEEGIGVVLPERVDGVLGQPRPDRLPGLVGGPPPHRFRRGHRRTRGITGTVSGRCSPRA